MKSQLTPSTPDDALEFAESIINTVREPLIALDQDLRVVTASRSFYEFFKVNSEETVGQLIYDLGNKQWDIPKLRELLETILPQKTTFENYEVEHDFSAIGKRNMLLDARQIERVLGKERIILLAIEDITERKRAEERALASSDYARSLIEASLDPLVTISAQGTITDVNEASVYATGVPREKLIGRDFSDYFTQPEEARAGYQKAFSEGFVRDYPLAIRHATGRIIDVLYNAAVYRDSEGEVLGVFAAARDVTERREIELGLETARQELAKTKIAEDAARSYAESIINTVREPLIALDQDLRVVSASRSFYEVFRVKPEETVGQLIYDLGNNQWDIPRLRELLETILPHKATFDDYEVEHDFSDIGVRIMLLNARQIQRAVGEERIILLAIEDITKRRQVEKALLAANQAVEAASRAKSEFLANMSHELRTPLNSIIGFSEVLHDQTFGPLNPKQTRYVDNVLGAGEHLLSLINDILDLSKVEAGKMEIQGKLCAVRPLLESSISLVKERALKRGLALQLEVPPDLTVFVDERMFKQILFNLLSNAVKFTDAGGRITVTGEQRGEDLCVCVSDTGIGIDAADQTRLFTEFEQLDSGYDRIHQGTGLGLALTRKFVELHGGRIWVESEGKNRGSSFCFTLPLLQEAAQAPDEVRAPS